MNPAVKLGAYGVVLGLALAGGAAAGELAGPIDVGEPETHDVHEPMSPASDEPASHDTHIDEPEPVAEDPAHPYDVSLDVDPDTGEATVTVRHGGEVVHTERFVVEPDGTDAHEGH